MEQIVTEYQEKKLGPVVRDIVKVFHARQKKELGYLKYRACGSGNDFRIECQTKNGLYIRNKQSNASQQQLIDKIKDLSKYLF